MHTVPTDFYFLGERDYVHGPTILGAFLSTLNTLCGSAEPPAARVVTCRFRKYLRENGTVLAWGASEEPPDMRMGEVCATATISAAGGTYRFAVLPRGDSSIRCRMPYEEGAYLAHVVQVADFSGSASIQNVRTKKDLVRAIVALNKKLHDLRMEAHAQSGRYRWSFASVEGLELPAIPAESAGDAPSFEGLLSLESASVWSVGGNLHTVSRGQVRLADFPPCSFQIGFAGHLR